ncbi:hypothetical protein K1719_045992 [Acacia pycnantha]|nr:hypothetical protein K1719_045992 [Acacia pycnantha]
METSLSDSLSVLVVLASSCNPITLNRNNYSANPSNYKLLEEDSVIKILDAFYRDRHYARFFVLETIARVPYFAFISVPHLYESFCWWRRADYLN